MKLSLAVALSHDAKLFILDEATAGLDPAGRAEILEVCVAIVKEKKARDFNVIAYYERY